MLRTPRFEEPIEESWDFITGIITGMTFKDKKNECMATLLKD